MSLDSVTAVLSLLLQCTVKVAVSGLACLCRQRLLRRRFAGRVILETIGNQVQTGKETNRVYARATSAVT
jgi:hypothetical protein